MTSLTEIDLSNLVEDSDIEAKKAVGSEHLAESSEHLAESSEHLTILEDPALTARNRKKVPKELMEKAILSLCRDQFIPLKQMADELNRSPDTLRVHYLNRMVKGNMLELRYPDKPNHPDQGYRSKANG